ncbi:cytochrome b [Vreelandella utahensis]|uniref:cytochrome b n=1 Tax=Vreelandella halophila TaxID=86177 RepID=UPI0015C3F559|nr:cytochrome b/b6 domain-containing protein [Halomonas utahensis]
MINDSKERYGSVSKFLHWLMAVLVIWQLLKFGDRISEGEHWIGQTLVPWHISIGTLLLGLIVLRLLWVMSQRRHRPRQRPATAKLVKAGHGLLFAGMLLLPLTGILAMLGGGYGLTAFGIEIFAEGREIAWASSLGDLHSPLAWAFGVLVLGHTGIALFHHFAQRDDTLTRML